MYTLDLGTANRWASDGTNPTLWTGNGLLSGEKIRIKYDKGMVCCISSVNAIDYYDNFHPTNQLLEKLWYNDKLKT
jgi:hypothetical protein